MADALCGPSNPLQSLQKHTQIDRTLQQDRVTGPRHSPAQGFRSPDPRTGSLDAEFAAFEAGPANPFQLEPVFPGHAFPTFQAPQATPDWATDFRKLQISNSPVPSLQLRGEAPLFRSNVGGWHEEFMRQRQGGGTPVSRGKEAVRSIQPNGVAWSGPSSYMPMMQSEPEMMMGMNHPLHDQQLGGEGRFSDADFEQAFADAFQHVESMESQGETSTWEEVVKSREEVGVDVKGMLHEDGTYTNDHSVTQDVAEYSNRIGSDAIAYKEKQDRNAQQDSRDADELARTAGQLLSSVEHNTSTKFQESQFLALMRKIRDKEVEVRNEDFESTGKAVVLDSTQQVHAGEDLLPTTTTTSSQTPQQQTAKETQSFTFPDLNEVYNPNHSDTMHWHQHDADQVEQEDYGFDDDQFGRYQPSSYSSQQTAFQPQSQMQALHPGGQWYPREQSPTASRPEMSGGIGVGLEEKEATQ